MGRTQSLPDIYYEYLMRVNMSEIKLMEPNMNFAKEIWAFRQEILDSDDQDKFAGCGTLRTCSSAKEWIESIKMNRNVDTCPTDKVPSNGYIAVRTGDQKIVGIIDLRHHINHPILSTWGGHIGYYVRPDERQKGYATEMLRQNLINCKLLGLDRVMITCHENNVASEKTIVANGGVFEKNIEVDGEVLKRFWITL